VILRKDNFKKQLNRITANDISKNNTSDDSLKLEDDFKLSILNRISIGSDN
jgi:hypothetical protein